MKSHIFFDLDGTLVDSAPGLLVSIRSALRAFDLEDPGDRTLRSLLGKPIQELLATIGVADVLLGEVLAYFRAEYVRSGIYDVAVIPGMVEVLEALRDSACVLAVATSKPADYANVVLPHVGLASYFSFVAGATLDGTRRGKADVIAHALATLNIRPEDVVMVGDKAEDALGAAKFSIPTVGVLWGYGGAQEFDQPNVIGVATTTPELLDLLRTT